METRKVLLEPSWGIRKKVARKLPAILPIVEREKMVPDVTPSLCSVPRHFMR